MSHVHEFRRESQLVLFAVQGVLAVGLDKYLLYSRLKGETGYREIFHCNTLHGKVGSKAQQCPI